MLIINLTKEDNKYHGKAYAFFNTRAPKDVLPLVIEDARDFYKTPLTLELTLNEGFDKLKGDDRLMALAREAKKEGMKYVFEARYKGATNERTASEIGDILNGIYLGSKEIDKTYKARIVYEDMGRYIVREQHPSTRPKN